MSKKDLIISVIIVLIFIIGVGIGVYYFVSYSNPVISPVVVSKEDIEKKAQEDILKRKQAELEQLKKDFPDAIQGIIKFSGDKPEDKTTVKTDNGVEWTLWPDRPKSLYEHEGIRDGQRVEVRGKILDENRIQWRLVTPI